METFQDRRSKIKFCFLLDFLQNQFKPLKIFLIFINRILKFADFFHFQVINSTIFYLSLQKSVSLFRMLLNISLLVIFYSFFIIHHIFFILAYFFVLGQVYLNFRFPHFSYIIKLLFPFRNPTKFDIDILGGISSSICT